MGSYVLLKRAADEIDKQVRDKLRELNFDEWEIKQARSKKTPHLTKQLTIKQK